MSNFTGADPACPTPDVEFMPSVRLAGLVILVFTSIYFPVVMAWWGLRRRHTVLRKRSFRLMAISTIGLYLNVYTTCWPNWNGINTLPCELHAWTTLLVLPLAAGPIVARLVLFYSQARFNKLLLHEQARSTSLKDRFRRGDFRETVRAFSKVIQRRFQKRRALSSRGTGSVVDDDKITELSFSSSPASNAATSEVASAYGRSSVTSHLRWKMSVLFCMSHGLGFSFILITPFFLIAIISVVIQYLPADSPYGKGCIGCQLDQGDIISMAVILVLLISSSLFMLSKLRGVADPFRIKLELQIMLGFGALVVLSNVVVIADPGSLSEQRRIDWVYISNILCIMIFTTHCTLPVLGTYQGKGLIAASGNKAGKGAGKDISLVEVLTDDAARETFARYLATEFSVENLWFYDAVQQYEQQAATLSDARLLGLAKEIARSFIAEGSMMEVNVSFRARRDVRAGINESDSSGSRPPSDLFFPALKEVRDLLETDCYPRFKRSAMFQEVEMLPL